MGGLEPWSQLRDAFLPENANDLLFVLDHSVPATLRFF